MRAVAASGSVRTGVLTRPRLLEALDAPTARLTVLSASSGFGKTTLLREWVDRAGPATTVIWVTAGAEITTVDAFWDHVLHAATRQGILSADVCESVLAATTVGNDPVVLLRDFLLSPGWEQRSEVVLVLDAYENVRVGDGVIDDELVALVAQVPRLRVVVASRATTGLTAPGRVLRGEVEVIGQDALTFTAAEVGDLLAQVDGAAAGAAAGLSATRVEAETRGFPLALRAVLLGIGDLSGPADHQHWRSLVAADLLGQLDEDLHRFVLATAVPPYFDSDLAARLTEAVGGPVAESALAELERRGLGRWIPFAPDRPVFQYVETARDSFLAELDGAAPAAYARLAAIAAAWLFDNGMHTLALDLAIAGADYEFAEEVYRAMVLARPETYTSDGLNAYLSRVPPTVLPRYPVLAFGRGLSCLSNPATHHAAGEYLEIAAACLTENVSGLDWPQIVVQHTMKTVALRVLRRFAEAADAAARALVVYERIEDLDERRLIELRPIVLRQLAYASFQVGRVEKAVAVADRAISVAMTPWSRNYTAVYSLGFNAFDGRLHAAREARALVDPEAWPPQHAYTYVNALGRVGEATLRLDSFDFEGAEAEYEGCESFVYTSEFWAYLTWTLMHARLGRGQALIEAHRVAEALRGPNLPPGVGANIGTDALRGALAVLWLAAGRRNAARDVLRPKAIFTGQTAPAVALSRLLSGETSDLLTALPGLERCVGHTRRSRMATLTIGAAAALRERNEEVATTLLSRVVALDAGGGARLHLAYLPAEDLGALRDLARELGHREVESYLLGDVPSLLHDVEPLPVLSERERAVLLALVVHRTRSEVASALHVSENTVKTHLTNLYRKLGANSRETALQRAIALDLLSTPQD